MDTYTIRTLAASDFTKGHLQLLGQLTSIDVAAFTVDMYEEFVNSLNGNHRVYVIEEEGVIVATATLLVEQKLIHNMGKIGHIEDVVVDACMRGKGVGKKVINHLVAVAKEAGCYKIILDCSQHNEAFYQACGFETKGCFMAKYYE